METNSQPSSKHSSSDDKVAHPEKKKIKLDRSGLGVSLSSTCMSNGVKNEVKIAKKVPEEKNGRSNVQRPSVTTIKEISSHEKSSLKRPPSDSDDDDKPLVGRSKLKLSVTSHTNKTKSPVKDSLASNNDVKKIKKSTPEPNALSKIEKQKKSEGNEMAKKAKSESSSTNKTDGVKKIKTESGSANMAKTKLNSPKPETKSRTTDVAGKKIKTESGLNSSKAVKTVKTEGSLSDTSKKVKQDHEVLVKVKSENALKSPNVKKKDGLLSPKSEKQKSSSSPKTDGVKTEKHKTVKDGIKSPTSDEIKKEKHKSLKSEGTPKRSDKEGKDSSTSPKIDGVKKEGEKVSSRKVEGIKKIKSESSLPEKKMKSSTDIAKAVKTKKVKTESSEVVKNRAASTVQTKIEDGDDDDDVPLASRVKAKPGTDAKKKTPSSRERKRKGSDDEDDDDYKPLKKRKSEGKAAVKKENVKKETPKAKKAKESEKAQKGKGKETKKEKKEEEVWKWWEEEKHPDGIKWLTLEHKGPYFPPEYESLPGSVNFYYDGKKVKLSAKTEEVAGFYAKMLDHDYTSKKIFNDNFFQDWRKEMTDEERALIKNLSKCDFKEIHAYYVQKNEERKAMSKEEKQKLKEKNEEILQEYGYCMMDGHRERVGNFKIEPPGLFRGRGDHPKQGKLKKRLKAKDIIINIGKDSKVPDPPEGQKWKAISHDNKVTWLACWIENIQGSYKYVMLNPTSRIKGEKDWQKYETARKLKDHIGKIRSDYTNDWKSKEMRIRQRGVALYFIDKLALRAGHEKDEDTADTVGCCSLRYEHIKLHRNLNEKEFVVEFDFLGKDSIHYHNLVEVEKRVFKNLELFQQGKSEGDDLFDRLSTASLNKYLSELMEGLSAKVFRTYNASMTLQDQLNKLEVEDNVAANVLGYNRANRAVAILCNHQRSAPKTFEQSMSNLQQKIDDKRKAIKDSKNELKDLKHEAKGGESVTLTRKIEKKKTAIERLKEQLFKLEVSQTDKNENKEIALGTSKLNYLDPRISIAWCLKNNVPIEKIYNKTQRQKFAWAIDMTEEDFVF